MGYVRMGVPEELVLGIAKLHGAKTFVETGTYHGGTTAWAARHFDKVITIEINPELSAQAAANLSRPFHVDFLVGDSLALLPGVVASLSSTAVFWLDSHFCGDGTGDTAKECPLLAELPLVAQAENPVILIDDARYFLGPPPPPHDPAQWPGIDDIFRLLARLLPGHITTLRDDVIICAPASVKPVLDQEWAEGFPRRYPRRQPPLLRHLWRHFLRTLHQLR